VLVGGLMVSTVFTLFLVPSLFSLVVGGKMGLARVVKKNEGRLADSKP